MTDLVRTRFAPSPTGSLHVGGARTALYCLLHARQHQRRGGEGAYVLRIEDTDQRRSTEASTQGLLRDLRWLGLDWDEGPGEDGAPNQYFQSQRLPRYQAAVAALVAAGHAYEAWESPEELDAMRKAAESTAEGSLRYRRRDYTADELAAFRAEGRTPVVRLAMPTHAFTVHDRILGDVTLAAEDVDDLVILKADGFPTYHFAVVIDDADMNITQVLRGQEHLMNTPKHLGIMERLNLTPPAYGHLPLIFNPEGSKMSKRDKAKVARKAARDAASARAREGHDPADWSWLADKTGLESDEVSGFIGRAHDSIATAEAIAAALDAPLPMIEVLDFRRAGYLPEALLNYLALLGWNPGDDREILTLDALIDSFDLGRVNTAAARFDPVKLQWVNAEHLRSATVERLEALHDAYLEVAPNSPLHRASAEQRRVLFELYRPRMTTFRDLDVLGGFFLIAPTTFDAAAVAKHLTKGGGLDRLAQVRACLADIGRWEAPSIEAALEAFVASAGIGLGRVAQPLRVALSGTAATPGLFETLAFFTRDEVLTRIDRALATLGSN